MSQKPENVSYVSSVDGQSPRGLINTEEAMRSVKKGGNLALVITATTGIVLTLAADFHLWYRGPWRESLAMLVGAFLVWAKTRIALKNYANQGPEHFLGDKDRILFSEDDETDG
jgi:hypothetical protein